MKRKSMGDIPSLAGVYRRTKLSTREQASTELARMEHEKARLERELGIWTAHQKRAQARLQGVNDRINAIKQTLEPPAMPSLQIGNSGEAAQSGNGEREQKPGWREVSLEY